MPKVNNKKVAIQTLLERGVDAIYPSKQFLQSLLQKGKPLTVYLGIDPTAPVLHLGTAVVLRKLRQFQDLGHKVVLLVGDFTAMSGDPDKTEVRKRLTKKDILVNCRDYQKQAGTLLKFAGTNKAEYKFNSTWLAKLKFTDVVDLVSNVTVQRMLERDLFERRIQAGKPLYLHEFLYPLMQGYDSVAMNVDGEIGASDQTFNMLIGRDLLKIYKKKEKFVLTTKLLVDGTGRKMGMTEGNMVMLTDSANEMFGKVMSWTDELIEPALELLTDVQMSEIAEMKKGMQAGSVNPRNAKAALAQLVVAQFHGTKKAQDAEKAFVKTFSKKRTPDNVPRVARPPRAVSVADFLTKHKLVSSKSEARRLVDQGGVKLNQNKVTDWSTKFSLKSGDVVQVGKRKFVKIK